MPGTPVPIAVEKYDGHRRFVVETVALVTTPALLVMRGERGRRFVTADGTRLLPTITLEYFPVGRWYNVISLFDSGTGQLERHFCNVMTPAIWDGTVLRYVDLDLDLVVTPDGQAMVEDLDDFHRHARDWHYPAALRHAAFAALRELRDLVARGLAPFTADPFPRAEARARQLETVWTRPNSAGEQRAKTRC